MACCRRYLCRRNSFCGLIAETMLEARRANWYRVSQSARNLARAMAEEMERTV